MSFVERVAELMLNDLLVVGIWLWITRGKRDE